MHCAALSSRGKEQAGTEHIETSFYPNQVVVQRSGLVSSYHLILIIIFKKKKKTSMAGILEFWVHLSNHCL